MYQGKFRSTQGGSPRKRRPRWRKQFLVLCAASALLLGVVGGTVAYLTATTSDVVNTFTPAEYGVDIVEEFKGKEKKNVYAVNHSEYPVYLRGRYVVYWVDAEDGKTILPGGGGIKVEWEDSWKEDWVAGPIGGWFYCKEILPPGESSPVFPYKSVSPREPKEGQKLVVDVIMETIQADPPDAVKQIWGEYVPLLGLN